MVDFNKARESVGGNVITPKAKISYPYLLEPNPRAKTHDGKSKYTTSILIPPGADITLLKQAAEKAAREEFGERLEGLISSGKFKSPFLDAYAKSKTEKNPGGDEWAKGWVLIRSSSIQKPGVVDHMNNNVDDASQIYPGRWACISLRPFTYSTDGNIGVSFGLQNVQLLDHDDPIAGTAVRAENEFEQVDLGGGAEGGEDKPAEGRSADSVFG